MDASGNKRTATAGSVGAVLSVNASGIMDTAPAACDQNRDLKEPICFEKTPPKKS